MDLSLHDKKALLAILKYIASADGRISENELAKFTKLAEEKGFEDFSGVFASVDSEVKSMNDLDKLILEVDSSRRKEILTLALEMAESDGVSDSEKDLINFLSRVWNIPTEELLG